MVAAGLLAPLHHPASRSETTSVHAPPDDPYAFLPKPYVNNGVHTTVNFSDGRIMRIANSPEVRRDTGDLGVRSAGIVLPL